MNQILVTKKIYVTPELRKKKKMYKFQFFLCVFLVCLLFSYYIYAEYDKSKSEEVSQEILAQVLDDTEEQTPKGDKTIKKTDNIIVVALDDNEEPEIQQTAATTEPTPTTSTNSETAKAFGTYKTESGTSYTTEAILNVPRLGIYYPVLSYTSEALLKISLNKYWGPAPHTVANYSKVGHNYKSKKMFGRLSEIVSGDKVELTDSSGETITYEVYDKYVVEPTDTACTSQITNGRREVTLITCTNYGKQRLVVKAREVK